MPSLSEYQGRLTSALRRAGISHVHPSAVSAAVVGLAILFCLGLWRWWPSRDEGLGLDASTGASPAASADVHGSSYATRPAAPAFVHVVGSVRRPGVYSLPAGSRVIDAVAAAGGLLPDAVCAAVNMARVIKDGEQIAIPDQDDVKHPGGAVPSGLEPGGPVDINSADAQALDALPGIGPATAAKIIADRETNGPFSAVEDLGRIPGIGEKKLAQLKGLVCVR